MGWEEREFDLGDLAVSTGTGTAIGGVGGAGFFGVGKGLGPVWNRIVSSRVGSSFDDVVDAGSGVVDDVLGACHSFDGGTGVVMGDGSLKEIVSVRVGDRVRAMDVVSGGVVVRSVVGVHEHDDSDRADVMVSDDDGGVVVVRTTEHHRFWSVSEDGWVDAVDLTTGDVLGDVDGSVVTVVGVEVFSGSQVMFDLTVEDVHSFFVGEVSTTVLVHNCNIPNGSATERYPGKGRGVHAD